MDSAWLVPAPSRWARWPPRYAPAVAATRPPETGGYAVCTLNGKAVAGIVTAMAPDDQPTPPTAWTCYLATEDADATAQATRARGQAQAIATVFQAIHEGNPDQRLLAYKYLEMLPEIAQGGANKLWIVPSELGKALEGLGSLFGNANDGAPESGRPQVGGESPDALPGPDGAGSITRLPR